MKTLDASADAPVESTVDPTTASVEAAHAERDRLRAEVLRLSQALVVAYTNVEAVSAERDHLGAETNRLNKIVDTMFVAGYDQAVGEIRDHFAKAKQAEVVREIETIWLKRSTS